MTRVVPTHSPQTPLGAPADSPAPEPAAPKPADAADLPAARIQPRRRFSWAWILPVLALGLAGIFAYQAWADRGPTITVEFDAGAGIGPGDPVSYRGVRVGDIEEVRLTPDLRRVAVVARLHRDAAGLAREGSRFWIVRPEISVGRVSGLDTILGPRYLEGEPGTGPVARRFVGLDRPPSGAGGAGTLQIVVEAPQRGSLGVDSPVLYRGIAVGSVRAMQLSADARTVEVTLGIDPAYRHLVRVNSRFWNAGGLGLDWGWLRGLSVKAGSIESLVVGGIAFATPTRAGEQATDGYRFPLASEPKSEWLEWAPVLGAEPAP